jgi:hypothetical protein
MPGPLEVVVGRKSYQALRQDTIAHRFCPDIARKQSDWDMCFEK